MRGLPAVQAGRSEPTQNWVNRLSPPRRAAGLAPGDRSGAGRVPVSMPVSMPVGSAGGAEGTREKIRLFFCQRFTRRLDVVLDVAVVIDVSVLVFS